MTSPDPGKYEGGDHFPGEGPGEQLDLSDGRGVPLDQSYPDAMVQALKGDSGGQDH